MAISTAPMPGSCPTAAAPSSTTDGVTQAISRSSTNMADLRSGDGPYRPAGPRCCTRVRASRAAERRSIRMAKRGDKPSKRAERPRGGVVETVTDVIVDADGTVTPVSGRMAKELHKLEKKLAAARKTEAKRLRQLQAAE